MKKCLSIICWIILLAAWIIEPVYAALSDESEEPVVFFGDGKISGAISDYDATEQYVFFVCAEKTASAEVYDMNGQYAFSISFRNKSNGGVSVRCVDGLTYFQTKCDNVFVFDGSTLIEKMNYSEAQEKGYTYYWFVEKDRAIAVRGLYLYRVDTGEEQTKIPVPFHVLYHLYSVRLSWLILLIGFLLFFIRYRQEKKAKK